MIKGTYPVAQFEKIETPFYFYDIDLLRQTLDVVKKETTNKPYHMHYAVKANTNPRLLKEIAAYGFGADCVSGNEVLHALENGFSADKIVFAGVGKTDREIAIGLDNDILCFNVESLPELERIDFLATEKGKVANIALRLNPNVDAHTHKYITTGLTENKFGLNEEDVPTALKMIALSDHLLLVGIHFHIGSQITDMSSFENLCVRVMQIQEEFNRQGITLKSINVGGGLGVNYQHPNHCPIADFEAYFRIFEKYIKLHEGQTLHFELGRSIVAACGTLVSRVIYEKLGVSKKFLIIDAGMTDLIRPALYQAFHHIENITSDGGLTKYDVVGPICESSDVFSKDVWLNEGSRNDLIAIRTAGAYGEIMASQYNCRALPKSYFSDTVNDI